MCLSSLKKIYRHFQFALRLTLRTKGHSTQCSSEIHRRDEAAQDFLDADENRHAHARTTISCIVEDRELLEIQMPPSPGHSPSPCLTNSAVGSHSTKSKCLQPPAGPAKRTDSGSGHNLSSQGSDPIQGNLLATADSNQQDAHTRWSLGLDIDKFPKPPQVYRPVAITPLARTCSISPSISLVGSTASPTALPAIKLEYIDTSPHALTTNEKSSVGGTSRKGKTRVQESGALSSYNSAQGMYPKTALSGYSDEIYAFSEMLDECAEAAKIAL